MNQSKHPAHPKMRVFAGILIGLAASALAPVLMAASCAVFIYPILTLFIYAFSGTGAAICAIALNTLAMDLYFGLPGTIIALTLFALPACVMIRGVRWRRPIAAQMRSALIAQLLGIALALTGLRLYTGEALIDAMVELLRGYMQQVSPEILDAVLVRLFSGELPLASVESDAVGAVLTAAQRADYLDAFMGQMNASLTLSLPGYLLSSAAVTAVISVFISNYTLRNEPDRDGCYIPVSRWFTPWQVSLGIIATLAVLFIMYSAGLNGVYSVFNALLALLRTVFAVQAVISLERRMLAMNCRRWLRILLIVLLLIFASSAAIVYGAFSTMFGVHSAFKQLRIKWRGNNGSDDI